MCDDEASENDAHHGNDAGTDRNRSGTRRPAVRDSVAFEEFSCAEAAIVRIRDENRASCWLQSTLAVPVRR